MTWADTLVLWRALWAILFTVLWVAGVMLIGAAWLVIGGPLWSRR